MNCKERTKDNSDNEPKQGGENAIAMKNRTAPENKTSLKNKNALKNKTTPENKTALESMTAPEKTIGELNLEITELKEQVLQEAEKEVYSALTPLLPYYPSRGEVWQVNWF